MKDTKKLLQEALRSLPDHSDYSSVRYSIRKMIAEITKLQSKQGRKAVITPAQQWKLNLETGMLASPFATKDTLKLVDEMISQEQKKLDELQKPKDTPQPQSPLLG